MIFNEAMGVVGTCVEESVRALRRVRRRPLASAVAALAIALGVGVTAPVASYLRQTLLQRSLFPQIGQLVLLSADSEGSPAAVSGRELDRLRSLSVGFESVGGFADAGTGVTTLHGAAPEQTPIAWSFLEAQTFRTLAVQPLLGRIYTENEEQQGELVAVISYELFRRAYQGDAKALGQWMAVDLSRRYRIAGVMPRGFRFPVATPDVWVPVPKDLGARIDVRSLQAVARIRSDVAIQAVQTTLNAGNAIRGSQLTLVPLDAVLSSAARRAAPLIMLGAVAALLLSTAVVWHVYWSDALNSHAEIGTRLALGASRTRACGVFLLQALIVSVAGSAAGVPVASYVTNVVRLRALDPSAQLVSVADPAVIGAVIGLYVVIGTIAGAVPILRYWGSDIGGLLNESRSGSSERVGSISPILTATQVGCAACLAICAALAWRSVVNLGRVSPGFGTDRLLTIQVRHPRAAPPTVSIRPSPQAGDFFEQLLDGVRRIPGVVGATSSMNLPMYGGRIQSFMRADDAISGCGDGIQVAMVAGDYFKTLALPVREGRALAASDENGLENLVVNRTLASRCWPGQSAIGRVPRFMGTHPMTIVGVVEDVPMFGLRKPAPPTVYLPASLLGSPPGMQLIVRVAGDPYRVYPAIAGVVRRMDPDVRFLRVRSMEDVLADGEAPLAARAKLLGAAGLCAFVIAGLGVYATTAVMARRRRHELAIRVALGATYRRLLATFAFKALCWSVPGLLAGGALAYWGALSLAPVLFGVEPFDTPIYGASIGILALLVVIAAWIGGGGIGHVDVARSLCRD
jgi:predicted permease